MGRRSVSLEDRFWAKVDRDGPVANPYLGACWSWTGAKHQAGYGRITLSAPLYGSTVYAHRVSYELSVGPIPDGLTLDHLCRNRACVNPAHLEPVTSAENTLRGDAPSVRAYRMGVCKRGHSLDDAYTRKTGARMCRKCHAENSRAGYHRRKELTT